MSTSAPSLTDHYIIARCGSGDLTLDIDRFDTDESNPDSLLNRCVSLHNSGQMDLLSLIDTQQFSSTDGHTFFVLQHFFCEAIPQLIAPPDRIMRAVKVLVERGGNDGMANMPNLALRKWCANDPSRAHLIVNLADKGDAIASLSLTFALEALGDIALVRATIAKYEDKRRASGMTALGRIKPSTQQEAKESADQLLSYVRPEHDSETRCNALSAFFNVCEPFPLLHTTEISQAVTAATAFFCEDTLYTLGQMLWRHPAVFDRASLKVALNAMTALDGTKTGIVHTIDYALSALLKTPNADLAADYLTTILSADGGTFELKKLQSVTHQIKSRDRNELFKLVVRWLVTGNYQLCDSVSQILSISDEASPFDTSTEGLGLRDDDHLFLAYKTLGYLFINPKIAASILVASIRGSEKVTATKLSQLLFDPLLINYGGVEEYLRTIKRKDRAFSQVQRALKQANTYYEALELPAPIKEMRPTEHQRNAERIRAQDMMRQIQTEADKQSIFANLVHRSTLLYGRKSLTFVDGPDHKRRPFAMDLHSFGTSFEMPRMEVLDPVGLNYTLRLFRSAKRK